MLANLGNDHRAREIKVGIEFVFRFFLDRFGIGLTVKDCWERVPCWLI